MSNTEPPKPIIGTVLKNKLPKGFSYPLGAMEISSALYGIPQFDNVELWFRWRDGELGTSEWRKHINAGAVIKLFEYRYFNVIYRATWAIFLYSVPSQYSVLAREHLQKELVRVRAELLAAKNNSKSTKSSVTFDLSWAKAELVKRSCRKGL